MLSDLAGYCMLACGKGLVHTKTLGQTIQGDPGAKMRPCLQPSPTLCPCSWLELSSSAYLFQRACCSTSVEGWDFDAFSSSLI
jgi:hypothetical protein